MVDEPLDDRPVTHPWDKEFERDVERIMDRTFSGGTGCLWFRGSGSEFYFCMDTAFDPDKTPIPALGGVRRLYGCWCGSQPGWSDIDMAEVTSIEYRNGLPWHEVEEAARECGARPKWNTWKAPQKSGAREPTGYWVERG